MKVRANNLSLLIYNYIKGLIKKWPILFKHKFKNNKY